MMARVEFDEQPLAAYVQLEKANANAMLDAIDDAVDLLESDPASAGTRRRSFGEGLWGIPVRDRSDDWLIIWEHDAEGDDLVPGGGPLPRYRPVQAAPGLASECSSEVPQPHLTLPFAANRHRQKSGTRRPRETVEMPGSGPARRSRIQGPGQARPGPRPAALMARTGGLARLVPLTVDGLIYASSMVMLQAARRRVPVPALVVWLLAP